MCVLVEGRASLVVWREGVTVEHIRAMGEVTARDSTGTLVWLPEGGTRVPDDVRQELAQIMRGTPDGIIHNRGLAYVLDTPGFSAAIARTAITALNLLARPAYPVKVFSTLEAAFEWLVAQGAVKGDPGSLSMQVRAADDAHRARVGA